MKLSELLAGHDHEVLLGDTETRITGGACFDAHRVSSGSLFIAVPGHREGGLELVGPALARGAVAVLVDRAVPDAVWASADGVCVVRVADTRKAAAVVTSRYYGEPGRAMDMVAVTGTNGKTSVSYMVESLLRIAEGARVGVIGTAGSRIGDELIPMPRSVLTTPESPDFQYLLGCMRDREVTTVVLEATSMGLLTHRIDRAFLDVGIFTNLTQDHLDDHGTMENYRDAKLRLFQGLSPARGGQRGRPRGSRDPGHDARRGIDVRTRRRGRLPGDRPQHERPRYAIHPPPRFYRKYPAAIPVPGRFSVSNALAAVAACHLLGHDLTGLVAALDRMPAVPGRFERFETPRGTSVIVDYAHSPDSLDKVLTAIRDFATGQVFTVFGCGGDRDVTKRAKMGEIAGTHSDLCVLTSDNPRNEDPEAILDQIAPGLAVSGTRFERFADRREAIAFALDAAGPGDIVLVAGRGSEPYQTVGEQLLPFSDMATARELAAAQL